ncbi:hypothetical protein [Streptomyces nigrescens]
MDEPSWDDQRNGGRVRVALWLLQVVGEGGVFTKEEVRDAFPGVSQIDRRMRELRASGWQILTSLNDASLKPNEHRFVKRGEPVWEPGKSKAKPKSSLTPSQRSEAMKADGYICRRCGIASGERYGSGLETAQLDIARREVRFPDGTVDVQLATECKRCREGSKGEIDLVELMDAISALGSVERKIFAQWMEADRRSYSSLEKLWGTYRTLPLQSRSAIRQSVLGRDQ